MHRIVPELIIPAARAKAPGVESSSPCSPATVLSDASSPGPAISVFAPSDYSTPAPPTPEPFTPEGYVTPDPPTPESGAFTPGYFDTPHTPQHQIIISNDTASPSDSPSSDTTITDDEVIMREDLQTRSRHMTRDERLRAQTLRDAGWRIRRIADHMGKSYYQIRYACHHCLTPHKDRKGRRKKLNDKQIAELIRFVTASRANRRLSWRSLPRALGWNVSEATIRRALHAAAFRRCRALTKLPISEKNRKRRLNWAKRHLNWKRKDWEVLLFTDETWATGGRHCRVEVTRRPGEEWEPVCVEEKPARKAGWMFWGSFSGKWGKEPAIFWEKD